MRKTILALLVFLSSVFLIATTTSGQRAIFYGQNSSSVSGGCPFTDSFSGSGALSGAWTSFSAAFLGAGTIIRSGGFATVNTDGSIAASLVTGGGCAFPADQSAQVAMNASDGRVMPMVRASSSGNGYGMYVQASGGVLILMMTSGGGSVLGTNSCIGASGNTYKIGVVGSVITVYQNGTSCGTATDSTYATGLPGLFIDNSGGVAVQTQALNFQAD